MFSSNSIALAISLTDLENASRLYASGNNAGALRSVDKAITQKPDEPTAHYLKANCLVKLNKLHDAIAEYSLAERLSPRSPTARYCHDMILRINAKTAAQAAHAGSANANRLPPGTLELINKQAILARERAVEIGEAEAENERLKADNQAKSIREKAERMAVRGNGTEPVALSPQELDSIRNQAASSMEHLKDQGKLKAAIKEQESRDKADEIQRQAENLQSQLLNDRQTQNTEIKLNPIGTNFYIRNYSNVRSPLVPLHAQAKSISGDGILRSSETSAHLNNESAAGKISHGSKPGLRSVTSVKGQLLPK